jgi:DNA-binding NarL/FixJ family response regulator
VSRQRPVRVLVADDSLAFRSAAVDLVAAIPDFEVVGVAESGEGAVDLALETRPDLVVMDVRMPGLGGIDAARRIHEARTATVIVLITADSGATARQQTTFPVLEKRALTPAALEEAWVSAGGFGDASSGEV